MTVGEWLQAATRHLTGASIATAHLDALVLLEDCLGTDRAQLLAHPETKLTTEHIKELDARVARRAGHEPLAYIRGKSEFYGRYFYVDHHVLEPRPESETMIDLLKKLPLAKSPIIIDIGTGSGALAITAKLELPRADVFAVDIDKGSLEVAQRNAERLDAEIYFEKGDLLKPFFNQPLRSCVLLCNLPYVPDSFHINPAAMQEPHLAIFGGGDGLDVYRRLFKQTEPLAYKPDYVLTESLPPQHQVLQQLAREHGYRQIHEQDFIQVFQH